MSNSNETEMNIAAEMKAHKEAETEGSKGRCLLSMSDLSLCVCQAFCCCHPLISFIIHSFVLPVCVFLCVCVFVKTEGGRGERDITLNQPTERHVESDTFSCIACVCVCLWLGARCPN